MRNSQCTIYSSGLFISHNDKIMSFNVLYSVKLRKSLLNHSLGTNITTLRERENESNHFQPICQAEFSNRVLTRQTLVSLAPPPTNQMPSIDPTASTSSPSTEEGVEMKPSQMHWKLISTAGRARHGILHLREGRRVHTPVFMPVGTQGGSPFISPPLSI